MQLGVASMLMIENFDQKKPPNLMENKYKSSVNSTNYFGQFIDRKHAIKHWLEKDYAIAQFFLFADIMTTNSYLCWTGLVNEMLLV